MPKRLLRIVALSLIPCFLANDVAQAEQFLLGKTSQKRILTPVAFQQQAFADRAIESAGFWRTSRANVRAKAQRILARTPGSGEGTPAVSPSSREPRALLIILNILAALARWRNQHTPQSKDMTRDLRSDHPGAAFFIPVDDQTFWVRESAANAFKDILPGLFGKSKLGLVITQREGDVQVPVGAYINVLMKLRKTDPETFFAFAALGPAEARNILKKIVHDYFLTPGNVFLFVGAAGSPQLLMNILAHEHAQGYFENDAPASDRELLARAFNAIMNSEHGEILRKYVSENGYKDEVEKGDWWSEFWTWMLFPPADDPAVIERLHETREVLLEAIERGNPEAASRLREILRRTESESRQWANGKVAVALRVLRGETTGRGNTEHLSPRILISPDENSPSQHHWFRNQLAKAVASEWLGIARWPLAALIANRKSTQQAESKLERLRADFISLHRWPEHVLRRMRRTKVFVIDHLPLDGQVEAHPFGYNIILLNTAFVEKLTAAQYAYLIGHEFGHPWFFDMEYGRRMTPVHWNHLPEPVSRERAEDLADMAGILAARLLEPSHPRGEIAQWLRITGSIDDFIKTAFHFGPHRNPVDRTGFIDQQDLRSKKELLAEIVQAISHEPMRDAFFWRHRLSRWFVGLVRHFALPLNVMAILHFRPHQSMISRFVVSYILAQLVLEAGRELLGPFVGPWLRSLADRWRDSDDPPSSEINSFRLNRESAHLKSLISADA